MTADPPYSCRLLSSSCWPGGAPDTFYLLTSAQHTAHGTHLSSGGHKIKHREFHNHMKAPCHVHWQHKIATWKPHFSTFACYLNQMDGIQAAATCLSGVFALLRIWSMRNWRARPGSVQRVLRQSGKSLTAWHVYVQGRTGSVRCICRTFLALKYLKANILPKYVEQDRALGILKLNISRNARKNEWMLSKLPRSYWMSGELFWIG